MVFATLLRPFVQYMHWLHTQWPAGTVEKQPEVGVDGETNLKRVRVAGDLAGAPLLQFSADSGARAVRAFLAEGDLKSFGPADDIQDLAIIGGGVAGLSAAIEAEKCGLRYTVFEVAEPFTTISRLFGAGMRATCP
jgi:NosR/NirI family nitrous oxide reductase transcriptional regulator